MSLEQPINQLIQAIATLVAQAVMQQIQGQLGQSPAPQAAPPSYPPPTYDAQTQYQGQPAAAPQPVYQAPPQAAPAQQMPPPPFQQQAPSMGALPFNDAASAAAWSTAAWHQLAAVNQDAAGQGFQALLGKLGVADFSQLTPAHFPTLYEGVQAMKASAGIQG